MSLVRMFLQTVLALAAAGQWDLLRAYFELIDKIVTAPEAVVIPGLPKDKEL